MEDNTNIMSAAITRRFRTVPDVRLMRNALRRIFYLTGRILRIILTARLRNAVVRFRISLMKRYPKIKINSRESRTDAEKLRIKALKDV